MLGVVLALTIVNTVLQLVAVFQRHVAIVEARHTNGRRGFSADNESDPGGV
jgi:hypothetical protein